MEKIPIIYEDDYIVAINKPSGILMHRTNMSEDKVFLLQTLRDQLGCYLFPIHRLDRATSGIIVFAKSSEIATSLGNSFSTNEVQKNYLAIVRGWIKDDERIDYALKDEETKIYIPQEAITDYTCLGRSEIQEAIGLRYKTARFSLAMVQPITGRRQQIRKHFAHLRHPIIGDKRHGDVKHNSYFKENFNIEKMFLHAYSIEFCHPISTEKMYLVAPIDSIFLNGLLKCDLNLVYQNWINQ